jgi:transposase
MYRVKAVAEMFDVSVSTIYRVEAGKLEALKIGAGTERGSVRIPEYALRIFVEACAEAAYRTAALGDQPQPSPGASAGAA